MNALEQALQQLPAKPVAVLIAELLKIREAAKSDPEVRVPLAAFHLRSGRTLEGWVLSWGEEKAQTGLLVHAPGADPRQPKFDIHYIEPSLIEAITVFDAGTCAHLLSFGKITTPPGRSAPFQIGPASQSG